MVDRSSRPAKIRANMVADGSFAPGEWWIGEARFEDEQTYIRADIVAEMVEALSAIQSTPIEHDENGHAFRRVGCRSMNDMGAWIHCILCSFHEQPTFKGTQYAPWIALGMTPMAYWKMRYLELSKEINDEPTN